MEMGERMNEEFFVITCDEEVENCCRRLDELLISFRQPFYIRLSVSKAMFERTLGSIVPRLQFLNAGVISGLNVINDDYQVIDEDDFSLEQEIHRDSIIKFQIPREMCLKIYSRVIVLNEISGTVRLMKEESTLLAESVSHAKIITTKSAVSNYSKKKIYIKGDQVL